MKDEVQKYLSRLQNETKLAEKELFEIKKTEHQLQILKESLLNKRLQFSGEIQKRRNEIETARETLHHVPGKKMFDDIYPLVDSCYHTQLLELELKEQVMLAKALHEEKEYMELVEGFTESKASPKDLHDGATVHAWYKEMKHHTRTSSSKSAEDECFYHVTLTADRHDGINCGLPTMLSFTTRHKGYCLPLTIKQTSLSPINSCYVITCDVCLEGLQTAGQQHLNSGKSAVGFIKRVVWPLMEQQIFV